MRWTPRLVQEQRTRPVLLHCTPRRRWSSVHSRCWCEAHHNWRNSSVHSPCCCAVLHRGVGAARTVGDGAMHTTTAARAACVVGGGITHNRPQKESPPQTSRLSRRKANGRGLGYSRRVGDKQHGAACTILPGPASTTSQAEHRSASISLAS